MERPCWTLNYATDGIGRTYPQHHEMSLTPTVVIAGTAKLTDLISTALGTPGFLPGLLMSNKFRELLDRFQLPEHEFVPIQILHRKKELQGNYQILLF
jgi:hypothetical protein